MTRRNGEEEMRDDFPKAVSDDASTSSVLIAARNGYEGRDGDP